MAAALENSAGEPPRLRSLGPGKVQGPRCGPAGALPPRGPGRSGWRRTARHFSGGSRRWRSGCRSHSPAQSPRGGNRQSGRQKATMALWGASSRPSSRSLKWRCSPEARRFSRSLPTRRTPGERSKNRWRGVARQAPGRRCTRGKTTSAGQKRGNFHLWLDIHRRCLARAAAVGNVRWGAKYNYGLFRLFFHLLP